MSTTRLVFIGICIGLAVILMVMGIIFGKNSPHGTTSLTAKLSALVKKRGSDMPLPKNASVYFTVILALFLMVLVFVFSKK